MSKATQSERILAHLREHPEGITPLEALNEYGCLRLSARIYDLRAEGHQITEETHTTPTGKHVARYRLIGIAQTPPPAPTVKLREWVCAQCGAAAAYIGASAAGDKYGLGKCFHHGTTAVMTLYRDVR
jgi:hypothetical protein